MKSTRAVDMVEGEVLPATPEGIADQDPHMKISHPQEGKESIERTTEKKTEMTTEKEEMKEATQIKTEDIEETEVTAEAGEISTMEIEGQVYEGLTGRLIVRESLLQALP